MNKRTVYAASNMTLEVVARKSKKKGIFVFVRTKVGKAKAQIGMRRMFPLDDEAGALKRYDELNANVVAKGGWTLSRAKDGSTGGFSEIPEAPTAPVVEGPAAGKVGQKKAEPTAAAKNGGKK